jgi:hypothetical protein
MRNDYYVYAHYLNENDTTPFYIGKGCRNRAYSKSGRNKKWNELVTKNKGYVVKLIQENISEKDALVLETKLIQKYGKLSEGDGILVNKFSIGVSRNSSREIPIELEQQIKMSMMKLALEHKLRRAL